MEKDEYKRMYEIENSFWFYVTLHELILSVIHKNKKKETPSILDAGCGTGRLLDLLLPDSKAFGLDFSEEALTFCKKRGISNIGRGTITALPFKNGTFDIVTSVDVLYHMNVTDDTKAIREFWRVLKDGGIIIINVAALEILRGSHDKVVHTRKRYLKKELKNKLEQNGFKIVKASYRLFFLFIPILFLRIAGNIKKKKDAPKSDLKPLSGLLNLILIKVHQLENRLIELINLPIGSSLFFVAVKKQD